MKLFTVFFTLTCACSVGAEEQVSQQHEPWFDTCELTELEPVTVGDCGDWLFMTCKDGAKSVGFVPALAKLWIGSPCISDATNTFYYECDVVDGHARVTCRNW